MAQEIAENAAAAVVAEQAKQQGIAVDAQQVLSAKKAYDGMQQPTRKKNAVHPSAEGLKAAHVSILFLCDIERFSGGSSALAEGAARTDVRDGGEQGGAVDENPQGTADVRSRRTPRSVHGAQFVSNLIGFAYPAYMSVKALCTDGKDDDTQWLIYWTTFASFFLIDSVGVVFFHLFPIYWVLKSVFLVYLFLPETQGALYLYEKAVDPAVTFIDEQLLKKYL